jgi:hypothetical protein
MQVKGSVVRSIPEFIQMRFPDKYDLWIASLPPGSAAIFNGYVQSAEWYPFHEGVQIPTELLSKVAYNGDTRRAAWDCGRYGAESALKGIYKFFLMAAPPSLVIRRGSRIMATFYKPADIKIASEGNGWALLELTKFDELTEIVENRIGGWTERGLEIQGVPNPQVNIPRSMARGDKVTEISIKWT